MGSPRREGVFSADRGNKTSIKEFIGQKQGLSIKRDLPMGASPRRAWWDGWRRRAVHLQVGFKVLEAHFTVPIKHITAVYHFFSHLDITNPFFFYLLLYAVYFFSSFYYLFLMWLYDNYCRRYNGGPLPFWWNFIGNSSGPVSVQAFPWIPAVSRFLNSNFWLNKRKKKHF